MPLYHTNGLNNQLFSPLLACASIVLGGRFRAQDMPALMNLHRPTLITGVPTMYLRMLDHVFPPGSLASLRFERCGSAHLTRELHTETIGRASGREKVCTVVKLPAAACAIQNKPLSVK